MPISWHSCLCSPSPWVRAGPVTCFQSTEHGKGDRMSLSWLCYAIRFCLNRLELETPLADSEEVSCHAVRGHVARNCGQPWPTVSKKQEPQHYNCKDMNSANNLREHRGRSLPSRASDETAGPANTYNAAWCHLKQRIQISDRNSEIINVCCFEPLSLW